MPVIDSKATGEHIKELCLAKGLKCKDVQAIFNFSSPQAVYKWWRGDALPNIDNLVVLAYILDTKIDDLLITK